MIFEWAWLKIGSAFYFMRPYWANVLLADNDAIIFGSPNILLCIFDFWSTSVALVGPMPVTRRILWNKVCQSVCLSGHFLGIISLVFSKFWYGARNPYEVVCDSRVFQKIYFLHPKLWKCTENGSKAVSWIYWKIWQLIFTEFVL